MTSRRSQKGVAALIPLLILAALAISALVIAKKSQETQQTESQAARSSKKCDGSSTTAFSCRGAKVGDLCTGFLHSYTCDDTGSSDTEEGKYTCACVKNEGSSNTGGAPSDDPFNICDPGKCYDGGTTFGWRKCDSSGADAGRRYDPVRYNSKTECEGSGKTSQCTPGTCLFFRQAGIWKKCNLSGQTYTGSYPSRNACEVSNTSGN